MPKHKQPTTPALWFYAPQCFVGLFFLSAAFLKWWEALFGQYRFPLDAIFKHWMSYGLSVSVYARFMEWASPHADILSGVVIACQAVAGLLLILNWRTRIAGALIIFVQLNVLLATYHQLELRVLNSQAILIGLYYFARPEMSGRLWKLMTYALYTILAVHLFGRATIFGDPLTSSFTWQHELFSSTVMSSWPGLKQGVLHVSALRVGPLFWASTWWIKAVCTFGLLTRYRLFAGAALLVLFIGDALIWLNVFSAEGVVVTLLLFVWVVQERLLQQESKSRPVTLLP